MKNIAFRLLTISIILSTTVPGYSLDVTGSAAASGISGIVPVSKGGTGQSSFTAGNILFGAGTSGINTTSTFTVSSNGNVGIGTASPGTLLDVNGATTIRGQETVTSSITVLGAGIDLLGSQSFSNTPSGHGRITNMTGAGMMIQGDASEATVQASLLDRNGNYYGYQFNVDGTMHISLNNRNTILNEGGGNVGINDTTPDAELDIKSGAAATGYVLSISSQSDVVGSMLSVLGNGNVGIGTASPSTLLHVSSGTLTIDGNTAASIQAYGTAVINTSAAIAAATQFQVGTSSFTVRTDGTALFSQFTKAKIDTIVPVVGAVVTCTDCTNTYTLCVATGTSAGQWRE